MEEIDSVILPGDATLTRSALYALLDQVRVHETIYKQAGAVHGCALATNEGEHAKILVQHQERFANRIHYRLRELTGFFELP